MLSGKRRAAVEHDARPHRVGVRFGIAQDRRRIREAARQRLAACHALERSSCHATPRASSALAKCVISVIAPTPGCSLQARERGGKLCRLEPQPVHAGVELDPHVERGAGRQIAQHVDLLGAVDDAREPVLGDDAKLARLEKAFEQHDALRVTGVAQPHRGFELDRRRTRRRRRSARAARSMP